MTGPLEIAAAAMPTGDGISLDGDLRLVKAGLLYGDKITLYSPGAAVLALHQRSLDRGPFGGDEQQRLDYMERTRPDTAEVVADLRRLEALRRKPYLSREERRQLEAYDGYRRAVELEFLAHLLPEQEALLGSAGFAELSAAVDAGFLTIAPIVTDDDEFLPEKEKLDRAMERFLEELGAVLADGRRYPLFDGFVGLLVSAGIADGRFHPVRGADDRGREAGLANEFIGELPAFPQASIQEILHIRRLLEVPLVRFRGVLVDLGDRIKSAPYDPSFAADVEQIAVAKIRPALLEIDEAIHTNTYLQQLVGRTVGDAKTLLGGAIAFGIAQTHDLPAMLGGGAGAAVQAAMAAAMEQRKEAKHIAQNEIYFLYRANELLA